MLNQNFNLLRKFKSEVTDFGPEACLPRSLSNYWLLTLIQSADSLLAGEDQAAEGALALAAVLTLLSRTKVRELMQYTDEHAIMKATNDFRIELSLELVHRRTKNKYNSADLQDIFTNRTVVTWHST